MSYSNSRILGMKTDKEKDEGHSASQIPRRLTQAHYFNMIPHFHIIFVHYLLVYFIFFISYSKCVFFRLIDKLISGIFNRTFSATQFSVLYTMVTVYTV